MIATLHPSLSLCSKNYNNIKQYVIAKLKNYQVLLLGLNYKKKRKKKMGKRERDVHARAPGEDLVFVAGDLEASAVLFEADHCNVGKPLLPYRLHQRPRHDSLFLRR